MGTVVIFIDDNVWSQNGRMILRYMKKEIILRIQWLSRTLELNSIEHMCNMFWKWIVSSNDPPNISKKGTDMCYYNNGHYYHKNVISITIENLHIGHVEHAFELVYIIQYTLSDRCFHKKFLIRNLFVKNAIVII